jgi:hypothetical protein
MLALVLAACTGGPDGSAERSADAPDAATSPDVDAAPAPDLGPARAVLVDEALVLVHPDGRRQVLTDIEPDVDGEIVHLSVRPGTRAVATVLALARTATDGPLRYELRYLTVTDHGASDLYWLPWRLQVDEELIGVLDVAPSPVWAPDGGAVAWIDWGPGATRLHVVGWWDDGVRSNPSDQVSVHDLDGLPAGAQLTAWEPGDDGPVLHASDGTHTWRIGLEVGDVGGLLAIDAGPAGGDGQ